MLSYICLVNDEVNKTLFEGNLLSQLYILQQRRNFTDLCTQILSWTESVRGQAGGSFCRFINPRELARKICFKYHTDRTFYGLFLSKMSHRKKIKPQPINLVHIYLKNYFVSA